MWANLILAALTVLLLGEATNTAVVGAENLETDSVGSELRHLRTRKKMKNAWRNLASSWETDAFPVADPIPVIYNEKTKGRPLMHTFYDPVIAKKHHFSTGMTESSDKALIDEWMKAWSAAGWEPKILTLDDAKKHPQFEKFNNLLEGIGMDYYNRLCMIRWLAMAAGGGGWMSDYDTFPINSFVVTTGSGDQVDPKKKVVLPNDGYLTVFDGAVPCLVSGSAKEYDRISRLLIEAVFGLSMPFKSDMYALQSMCKNRIECPYVQTRGAVIMGNRVLTKEEYTENDCNAIADQVAVHFAHAAISGAKRNGVLKPGAQMSERPRIAREWIQMWRKRCKQNTVVIAHSLPSKSSSS